jgi:hypothetical protein
MAAKTETKWTPGTLRIVDLRHQKNGQIKLVIDEGIAGGDHIANVMANQWRPETGTAASPDALAWANLLRASPHMYAALLAIVAEHDRAAAEIEPGFTCGCDRVCKVAHAALAKAEGR